MTLPCRLDRTVLIRARRDVVFAFLTDSERWASWWGAGSSIEARPGGRMLIRHPNGVEAAGNVVDVNPGDRIVFTYGYASGKASPPGSTLVTIRLDDHDEGTLLHLTHEFADPDARDEHVQGWRFQLSLFTNAVANAATAAAASAVDLWFEAWNDTDPAHRNETLARVASSQVKYHDRYSCLDGIDDLAAHVTAAHRFMPGIRTERRGTVRHCQWSVLADWTALTKDGAEHGRGTNLFQFDPDGRICSVTAFSAA
jgi:uncharacterized protein YndB with AHSA1/START domain